MWAKETVKSGGSKGRGEVAKSKGVGRMGWDEPIWPVGGSQDKALILNHTTL